MLKSLSDTSQQAQGVTPSALQMQRRRQTSFIESSGAFCKEETLLFEKDFSCTAICSRGAGTLRY